MDEASTGSPMLRGGQGSVSACCKSDSLTRICLTFQHPLFRGQLQYYRWLLLMSVFVCVTESPTAIAVPFVCCAHACGVLHSVGWLSNKNKHARKRGVGLDSSRFEAYEGDKGCSLISPGLWWPSWVRCVNSRKTAPSVPALVLPDNTGAMVQLCC